MVMSTRYLTINQVCELLQISEVSVRRKIRDGSIPAIRLTREGRGALRVPEHELRARLDGQHVTPDGEVA
jgi:excisionase family DNA binding protein